MASPPVPTVSPASAADKEWAARVMAASEPWRSLGVGIEECLSSIARSDVESYVAKRDGRALGFVILQRFGVASAPYIKSIAVVPEARGLGIGSALLEFAERRFRDEARFLFICVSSFNDRARSLYERHGFRPVASLDDHVIDGASEILLRKRLRAP